MAAIKGGYNHTFRACCEHSPNFETALLVTIQTNYAGWHGMQTFNQSLVKLFKDGLVTEADILEAATSADDVKLALRGIEQEIKQ